MLTMNLAFENWTEIFGSERFTGALLDRLTHRCYILLMGKVIDCDRLGNNLTGNPYHGRIQTHKRMTNDLTDNLTLIYS
jgi:hypothetical protein